MKKNALPFLFTILMVLSLACHAAANIDGKEYSFETGPQDLSQLEIPTAQAVEEQQTLAQSQAAEESDELFSVDVPTSVVPWKKNPDGCAPFPDETCNVFHQYGVLGVDNYSELYNADGTKKNNSGEWTGSKNHYIGYTPEVGLLLPEGSYGSAYAASLHVVGGGYDLRFNACDKCAWGFIGRGLNPEDGVDRNTALVISDYGALGALTVTRFAIEPQWAQYFSSGYADAQGINALKFDNCGIGDEDCEVFLLAVMDYNDGALTVLKFDGLNWAVVWTNVVQ